MADLGQVLSKVLLPTEQLDNLEDRGEARGGLS